jgi:hypothetical protein
MILCPRGDRERGPEHVAESTAIPALESVEVKALSERMRFGSLITWTITDGAIAPFLGRRLK